MWPNSSALRSSISVFSSILRTSSETIQKNRLNHSTSVRNDEIVEMENPFQKDKPECILCKMRITPDYKNIKLLSQFVSPFTGRIYGRHITGLCRRKQEQVETEILKARNAAFMPFYNKAPEYLEDPKLFNPERPFRPHKY